MRVKKAIFFDKAFKNERGEIVVWQSPNAPLWGWILCVAAAVIIKQGSIHSGIQYLGKLFLFTWAYLEIRAGESDFRRVLGAIVMFGIVYGLFKA